MMPSVVGPDPDPSAMRRGQDDAVAVIERPRRLALRPAWLAAGLAVAVYANALASDDGLGLVPLLVFGIVPHLSVLGGIGQPHARGQLAPRAVPLFNAMHHPGLPLVLAAVAAAGVLPTFWLVGSLAWFGHILVDRGLGDGPRTADGWLRRSRPLRLRFSAQAERGGE
jgi:hypothetical protein